MTPSNDLSADDLPAEVSPNTIEALLGELTDEELVGLCSGGDFWHTKSVKRLGIEAMLLTDGPHGLRKQTGAADSVGLGKSEASTCFPTASALASSWDADLMESVGGALAKEALAAGVAVVLGPGLNIKRSPLCGRGFEYFSEDPYLSGKLAAALIRGLESRGVAGCPKHFAVNSQETRRMVIDEIVDERALREIYLRGFEIAITEGSPSVLMCAYNKINGEYCSESRFLLTDVLREEWGFDGLVVSDWGAVNDRVVGLAAGLDLEMPASGGVNDQKLLAALKSGGLARSVVVLAARRLLELRQKAAAGGAERPLPADGPNLDALHGQNHTLARRAAAESLVLLKNDGDLLPFSESTKTIALIGDFAKNPRYQGSGSSRVNPTKVESLHTALEAEESAGRIVLRFAPGYEATGRDKSAPHGTAGDGAAPVSVRWGLSSGQEALVTDAVRTARGADAAVVCIGLTEEYESEGFDRSTLDLPPAHNALVQAVAEVNPKVVVVLHNGAPVLMPWLASVPAVVEAYLGGQAAGAAFADALLGRANPSGKLAETFPAALEDTPCSSMYPAAGSAAVHGESLFVGYRYYHSAELPVLFPFGHGLSYSRFEYNDAEVLAARAHGAAGPNAAEPAAVVTPSRAPNSKPRVAGRTPDGKIGRTAGEVTGPDLPRAVRVTVANTSDVDGAEVVQIYVRPCGPAILMPERTLAGFSKTRVRAHTHAVVDVALDDRAFSMWNGRGWAVEPGDYQLLIGSSSADIRLTRDLRIESPAKRGEKGDEEEAGEGGGLDKTKGDIRRRYLCAELPRYSVADKTAFVDGSPDGERARVFGDAGLPDPQTTPPRARFSLTSTLLEVSTTRVGRKLHEAAQAGAMETLTANAAESERRLIRAMVDEMPLRNMITMSNGDLSEKTVLALLHFMNRRPIRGLWGLLAARRENRGNTRRAP